MEVGHTIGCNGVDNAAHRGSVVGNDVAECVHLHKLMKMRQTQLSSSWPPLNNPFLAAARGYTVRRTLHEMCGHVLLGTCCHQVVTTKLRLLRSEVLPSAYLHSQEVALLDLPHGLAVHLGKPTLGGLHDVHVVGEHWGRVRRRRAWHCKHARVDHELLDAVKRPVYISRPKRTVRNAD